MTPKIEAKNPSAGDVWLWVAMDAESKLVPCWTLGDRDASAANAFIADFALRLKHREQTWMEKGNQV